MPAGNGTGPIGMGPGSGRGAGYCSGYDAPGYVSSGSNFNRGRRRGGAFRMRDGFGVRRHRYNCAPDYYNYSRAPMQTAQPELTPEKESEYLKSDAKRLQAELDSINTRISELEEMSS